MRYGPNVLRCTSRSTTACNSELYHIVNARSHHACGECQAMHQVLEVMSRIVTRVRFMAQGSCQHQLSGNLTPAGCGEGGKHNE